jgi:hypothetical protein
MLDCTVEQFDVAPSRLVADTGCGSAEMLGWLVGTGRDALRSSEAHPEARPIAPARAGPSRAKDEFLLAATAQKLRKLAMLIPLPAPIFAT